MAGIGFALERMTRGRTLSGVGGAYLCATILVAGPWIFIVAGIGGVGLAACQNTDCPGLSMFRSIVIYNTLISALITGPLALVCTRYVADRIWMQRYEGVTFCFVTALMLFAGAAMAVAGPFHLWSSELSVSESLAGMQNLLLMGAAWLLIPFLGAIRRYVAISIAFGLGAGVTLLAVVLRPDSSPTYLLVLFNIGLGATDFLLLCSLVSTFGIAVVPDEELASTAVTYWELPLIGLFAALGLWIDKVIMWAAASEGVTVVAGALRTMPDYDTPMFWAQLPAISVLVIFFIHVETNFTRRTRAFYGSLAQGVGRRDLVAMKLDLQAFVMTSLGGMLLAVTTVAVVAILASFVAIEPLGLRASQMAILRIGLIGMVFQTCSTLAFIFLLYFDLRRQAMAVTMSFFIMNGILTIALLPLGFPFYGYGNLIASFVTFIIAVAILVRELPWLDFHVFVTNNRSVATQGAVSSATSRPTD